MGASTVKWIALDPYLVFNESDSNLYTNFEFCEGKKEVIDKHINLQSQENYDEFFKKIQEKPTYFRR